MCLFGRVGETNRTNGELGKMIEKVSDKGDKLVRKVEIKILYGKVKKTLSHVAKPGRGYSQNGIDIILLKVAEMLDEQVPGYDFRLVQLGAGRYNLVGTEKEKEKINEIEAVLQ